MVNDMHIYIYVYIHKDEWMNAYAIRRITLIFERCHHSATKYGLYTEDLPVNVSIILKHLVNKWT